jgi:hypothetical protein
MSYRIGGEARRGLRGPYVAVLVALVSLAAVGVASAGWIQRQLSEWHDMTYCTSSLVAATGSVEHRWAWQLGWPPGRWTCVYRNGHGRVVATRSVP